MSFCWIHLFLCFLMSMFWFLFCLFVWKRYKFLSSWIYVIQNAGVFLSTVSCWMEIWGCRGVWKYRMASNFSTLRVLCVSAWFPNSCVCWYCQVRQLSFGISTKILFEEIGDLLVVYGLAVTGIFKMVVRVNHPENIGFLNIFSPGNFCP